jgi:hypothetical protein
MPIVQQIISTRGREFWDSLDPNNVRQVLEVVKEEFDRPEPAYQLHYHSSRGHIRVSQPCFRDCQVFLLHGAFFIEGQGRVTETGCSYLVKEEVWIGLCGSTTPVVMEEGEERGTCLKYTQESRERMLAEMQSPKKPKKSKSSRMENHTQCVLS